MVSVQFMYLSIQCWPASEQYSHVVKFYATKLPTFYFFDLFLLQNIHKGNARK